MQRNKMSKFASIALLSVCLLAGILVLSRAPVFLSASEEDVVQEETTDISTEIDEDTAEVEEESTEATEEAVETEETPSSEGSTTTAEDSSEEPTTDTAEDSTDDTEDTTVEETTEEASKEEDTTEEEIITSEEEIKFFNDGSVLDEPITYNISSQSEWNTLVNPSVANEMWAPGGTYLGEVDVIFNVTCDLVLSTELHTSNNNSITINTTGSVTTDNQISGLSMLTVEADGNVTIGGVIQDLTTLKIAGADVIFNEAVNSITRLEVEATEDVEFKAQFGGVTSISISTPGNINSNVPFVGMTSAIFMGSNVTISDRIQGLGSLKIAGQQIEVANVLSTESVDIYATGDVKLNKQFGSVTNVAVKAGGDIIASEDLSGVLNVNLETTNTIDVKAINGASGTQTVTLKSETVALDGNFNGIAIINIDCETLNVANTVFNGTTTATLNITNLVLTNPIVVGSADTLVKFNGTKKNFAGASSQLIEASGGPIKLELIDCEFTDINVALVDSPLAALTITDSDLVDIQVTPLVVQEDASLIVEGSTFSGKTGIDTTGVFGVNMSDYEGAASFSNCSFSGLEKGINSKSSTGPLSEITITDCEFTNCSYGIDVSGNPKKELEITECSFTDCKVGISAGSGNTLLGTISSCDFKLNSVIADSIAIDYAYASSSATITDCTIDLYDKALFLRNSSNAGSTADGEYYYVISNITATNVLYGYDHETGGMYALVKDCSFEGREGATFGFNSSGVAKNYSPNYNASTIDEAFNGFWKAEGLTIKGFETGIKCFAGNQYFNNCVISECNNGVYANATDAYFNHIDATAKDNPSVDSRGLFANSANAVVINSSFSGFYTGIENPTNNNTYANCKIDAVKYGIKTYQSVVYSCEIKTGYTGIKAIPDCDILNVKIEGPGKNVESIGIDDMSSAVKVTVLERTLYSDSYTYNHKNKSKYFYKWLDNTITGRNEIYGFKYGVASSDWTMWHFSVFSDTVIHDCEKGINQTYISIDDNNEIYNCDIGIDTTHGTSGGDWRMISTHTSLYSQEFYPNKIHDCDIGVYTDGQIYNCSIPDANGRFVECYEIYNCDDGIIAGENSFASSVQRISVHDCINGITWNSDDALYADITVYNNEEYNLILGPKSQVMFLGSANDMSEFLSNKGESKGNIYCASSNFQLYNPFKIRKAPLYLTEGSYVKLYTSTFDGELVFDVPDYSDGRKVAKIPHFTNGLKFIEQGQLWADKEGWVVTTNTKDYQYYGDYYLILTPGAEVTFDYKTNGGISMSAGEDVNGDPLPVYETKSYEEGSDVDLSYTAKKPGYEFVGWNTNKDATEALTSLQAGTENITLYAIYKKTSTVTYHTYDGTYTEDAAIFYNNETATSVKLAEYSGGTDHDFVGYVLAEDTVIKNADDLLSPGDNVTLNQDGTEVYCVYKVVGSLEYKHLKQEHDFAKDTKYCVTDDIISPVFSYKLIDASKLKGFTFTGWVSTDGEIHKAGSIFKTVKVSDVLVAKYEKIAVQSLVVTPETATVAPQSQIQLKAKVLPSDAFNTKVEWYSEDTAIASVDENGLVTGITEGVVKVYAKTLDGSNLKDYCTVTVKDDRVVTIKGHLTTTSNVPVANKDVTVSNAETKLSTTTDTTGYFEILSVPVGEYSFTVSDGDKVLAQCNITVAAPDSNDKDSVDVEETDENASVEYEIDADEFVIDIDVEEPTTEEVTTEEETTEEETTEEPTTEEDNDGGPTPATGDANPVGLVILIIVMCIGGMSGIALYDKKKN